MHIDMKEMARYQRNDAPMMELAVLVQEVCGSALLHIDQLLDN